MSRFIKGHTKGVFRKHNILTVYNIYGYMTILHLAKLIFLKEPLYLCALLRINEIENRPKRNNRIYLPKLSLKHYKNNFCYQGPKLWNTLCSLPTYCENITTAPTLNCLKGRVKRVFIDMQSSLMAMNLNGYL